MTTRIKERFETFTIGTVYSTNDLVTLVNGRHLYRSLVDNNTSVDFSSSSTTWIPIIRLKQKIIPLQTAAGSWTAPATMDIIVAGYGGGGGGANAYGGYGGGGGGGGAGLFSLKRKLISGDIITWTIGAGGLPERGTGNVGGSTLVYKNGDLILTCLGGIGAQLYNNGGQGRVGTGEIGYISTGGAGANGFLWGGSGGNHAYTSNILGTHNTVGGAGTGSGSGNTAAGGGGAGFGGNGADGTFQAVAALNNSGGGGGGGWEWPGGYGSAGGSGGLYIIY